MTTQPNLGPAALRMGDLIRALADELLGQPTPCERYSVGDLLDHIGGAALAFTGAATKPPLQAWNDPDAWTGMTRALLVRRDKPAWRRRWKSPASKE